MPSLNYYPTVWEIWLTNRLPERKARRILRSTIYTYLHLERGHHFQVFITHCDSLIILQLTLMNPNTISSNMEEALSSLWSSLSITDSESTTIIIDPSNLSIPDNALVGMLATIPVETLEKGKEKVGEEKKKTNSRKRQILNLSKEGGSQRSHR